MLNQCYEQEIRVHRLVVAFVLWPVCFINDCNMFLFLLIDCGNGMCLNREC